jgi:hypothetical protein
VADAAGAAGSAALLGAALAALGYAGRQLADFALQFWRRRQADFARLVELHSLLRATRAVFLVQIDQRDRLLRLIRRNHPEVSPDRGFDAAFSQAYPHLNPEEKQLHSIIRGVTEHSMKPLNDALSEWVKGDTVFKAGRRRGRTDRKLARLLGDLEAHLSLWHAKYQVWIPGHEEHALVYLDDEEQHGVKFPRELDRVVAEVVSRRHGPDDVTDGG